LTVCNTQKDIYLFILFIYCIFVRSHLAKKREKDLEMKTT
jgi:hypothetical protein